MNKKKNFLRIAKTEIWNLCLSREGGGDVEYGFGPDISPHMRLCERFPKHPKNVELYDNILDFFPYFCQTPTFDVKCRLETYRYVRFKRFYQNTRQKKTQKISKI